MSKSWQDTKQALQKRAVTPPTPGGDFWDDFKARARLHPQLDAESAPATPAFHFRWAWAAACALLLVVAGGVPVVMQSQAAPKLSTVQTYEVGAEHSGVLIMDDEESEATILWVVDMESDLAYGEST